MIIFDIQTCNKMNPIALITLAILTCLSTLTTVMHFLRLRKLSSKEEGSHSSSILSAGVSSTHYSELEKKLSEIQATIAKCKNLTHSTTPPTYPDMRTIQAALNSMTRALGSIENVYTNVEANLPKLTGDFPPTTESSQHLELSAKEPNPEQGANKQQ